MNRIRALLLLCACALAVTPARAAASVQLASGPFRGQSLRAGATARVWFAIGEKDEKPRTEEMEVLLSLDGGETFPIRVTGEMSEQQLGSTWQVPNLPTTRARLALRTGNDEDGEVVRAVSEEFTILPAETGLVDDIRLFRGEWRAGGALRELPYTAPFGSAGLAAVPGSLLALRNQSHIFRTRAAAPTGPPPDADWQPLAPAPTARECSPVSPGVLLVVPKRE